MEELKRLVFLLVIFLELSSCSQYPIPGSVSELTATPGDNITLYCDCRVSNGVFIVWYRNCSHENQPTLVLSVKELALSSSPEVRSRYNAMKNSSSGSYDLMIMNVTESDEGLYYCGTEERNIKDEKQTAGMLVYRYPGMFVYRYSNTTTRLSVRQRKPVVVVTVVLMFIPAFTILISVFFLVLVFVFSQKSAGRKRQHDQKCLHKGGQTRSNQDEDVYITTVLYTRVSRLLPSRPNVFTAHQMRSAERRLNSCSI